jgi:penicillin-binding protein 1C
VKSLSDFERPREARWRRRLSICALAAALVFAAHRLGKPPLLDGFAFSRAVYDRKGTLLRLTLASDDSYRNYVSLDRISPALIDATVLYEDRHFFRHPGVNPVALAKAAFETYLRHGRRRGGSTLSMQVARIVFRTNSATLSGKLVQIARAAQLEMYYSKRQLLEAYLNLAPYGGNVYGVGAASLIYFGKEPRALSLSEALALAAIPQNPGGRAPVSGEEPVALFEARARLAQAWLESHPGIAAEILGLTGRLAIRSPSNLPWLAPHAVIAALQLSGEPEVVTTLDLGVQALLDRRVKSYVERNRENGLTNAAVLLVDHRSMDVLAAIGSADFFDTSIAGQVDGTRAKRSPGSALKPFIYALAIDEGLIHPRSLLKDAPMRFGAYNPENFDNDFAGPLSATEALTKSRNVPAVYLESRLAGEGLRGLLQEAGVRGLKEREHYGLAIALGGAEVTAEEMAELYAALAQGGAHRPLRRLLKPVSSDRAHLFSPEAAALTLGMLREENPWERPGVEARDGIQAAWKTGTSYGFRDAWTAGVVGPYVLVVWLGHFDGHGDPALVGRKAAAPLFFELVEALRPYLMKQAMGVDREAPLRLASVEVCAVSGKVPTASCPHRVVTRIIPGVSPIERCDIHRQVHVLIDSGKRACRPDPPRTRPRVYEFWPSDLASLFARAGLARVPPPPFEAPCELDVAAGVHLRPQILSPQKELVYSARVGAQDALQIPLAAISDADVQQVTWFVGREHLGTARRGETLYWKPSAGEHLVRVVDDQGLSDSATVRVAWVE